VLCNDLGGAVAPLRRVEVFHQVVRIFLNRSQQLGGDWHRVVLRPVSKLKFNLIKLAFFVHPSLSHASLPELSL
jgi:hypothetical protein